MRVHIAAVGLLALLTAAAPGGATVYFENTGTLSGWTYASHDGGGSVTQVSSPVYKGSTANRHYQVYQGGDRTLHSETVKRDVGQNGQERYYGWTFYLPSNWTYPTPGQALMQLAADFSCGGQQTEMMEMYGTRLHVKTETVDPCNQTRATYTVADPVSRGVWHRVVVRKVWSPTSSAVTQIWFDGTRVVDRPGIANSFVGSQLYRWSIGLYAGFNSTDPVGLTRVVYTDHSRVASSYAEADPAQWGNTVTPTATPTPTPTAPAPTPTPCSGCGSGYYRILARHSGKAVVVAGASTANSGDVVQWTYGGSTANDEWQLVDLLNGYHKVVNRHSGKVLNVAGASTANGANVNQWSWANVNQQQWQITDLGTGYVRLTARHSGKVLNVAGASTADGANVDQWGWANVHQQQFQLIAVP